MQEPEQHERAQDVQHQVGDVIPAGVQPEELVIKHQRKPGQRMPEFGMDCAEGQMTPSIVNPD